MDDRFALGDLSTLSVNRDEHRLGAATRSAAGFSWAARAGAGLALFGLRWSFAYSLFVSDMCPRAAAGVDRRLAEAQFCSYIGGVPDCQYSNTVSCKDHV
jgi:hypothetical protein